MIVSVKGDFAEGVARGRPIKGFPSDILRSAQRKFAMLHFAKVLDDLKSPPGNRLEKLKGDREGQYSIRINDQWRICFVWTDAGPANVEIVDYH